jgi:RNA polymerase sigma factor (sigma-70 family)
MIDVHPAPLAQAPKAEPSLNLSSPPAPARISDAELLSAYGTTGAEAFFSQIVDRHSGMVYSACLRILTDPHAAEDAAQATFLVLTKRAASLPRQTVLSGWLYLTAQNTANAIKRAAQRRTRHEREVANMVTVPASPPINGDPAWEDMRDKLDAALSSLPSAQRDALILRYMNGLSESESAREMGCSERTLHTRVTRALAKLRDRFRRRGKDVSASVLVIFLSTRMSEVPPASTVPMIKAVCLGKVAATPVVAAAANSVVAAIFWAQVKLWLAATLLLAALSSAVYVAANHSLTSATKVEIAPVDEPSRTVAAEFRDAEIKPEAPADNDGRHLNDRTIWRSMGELKLDATAGEAKIAAVNADPEQWRAGGLLNHTAWDLSKYVVSIKVTADSACDCETKFFGICYFPIDSGELTDPGALERAVTDGSQFNSGQFIGQKRSSNFGTHVTELVLSNTEAVVTVDGKAQHIPFDQPIGGAFVGFRAGVRNVIDAQVFSIRDVVITKKEIPAPPEKF